MHSSSRAELEKLPTWQLDQMLQDENTDPETIRHILAVLQEREKDIPITFTDSEKLALERYKQREKAAARESAKKYGWLLRVACVVAVLSVLTVGMVRNVEADTFWERLVRWSDSVIEFFSPEYADGGQQKYEFRTAHPGLQQLYDTVTGLGVTEPVVPMWLPEGYELDSCKEIKTDKKTTVTVVFDNGKKTINYNLAVYFEGALNQYQKNRGDIKTIEIEGTVFYIVKNIDKQVVVWTKENIECSISVDCQKDVLYKILRSIYDKEEA